LCTTSAEFSTWWARLQEALAAPDAPARAALFSGILGAAFNEAVARSWIVSHCADLG
jgi:hypothetical protein